MSDLSSLKVFLCSRRHRNIFKNVLRFSPFDQLMLHNNDTFDCGNKIWKCVLYLYSFWNTDSSQFLYYTLYGRQGFSWSDLLIWTNFMSCTLENRKTKKWCKFLYESGRFQSNRNRRNYKIIVIYAKSLSLIFFKLNYFKSCWLMCSHEFLAFQHLLIQNYRHDLTTFNQGEFNRFLCLPDWLLDLHIYGSICQ